MAPRKFKIKIDGKLYEAEVEEIIEGEKGVFSENKRETYPPVVTSTTPNKPAFHITDKAVVAPMPGKIISIKCSIGQNVKRGDLLLILEAMKMEQEIKAKSDGTVSEIKVAAGNTVQKDEVLIIIS